jgi:hypothetical protein
LPTPAPAARSRDNRLGPADPDVRAGRLQCGGRSLVDTRHLPEDKAARSSAGAFIPAFIVPGHDAAHATSAARYLEECLPQSRYWDVAVEAQTEDATNPHVLEFLRAVKL